MERTTLALIAALGIAVVGAGAIAFGGEPPVRHGPVVEANGAYNQSAETLELQITQAQYTVRGESLTVETAVINHDPLDGDQTSDDYAMPTIVQQGGNISKEEYWYQQGGGGVQQSRPGVGDTITIIGDETDKDGDGRYGVENGEAYRLAVYFEDGQRAFDIIRIETGAVCGPECQGGGSENGTPTGG